MADQMHTLAGRESLTLYVPIISILDIWEATLFYEGESVVYDGFKYVWPVKGQPSNTPQGQL